MTKEELNEWLKTAEYIDYVWEETDDCCNFLEDRIYRKDGRYYKVYFLNGEVSSLLKPQSSEKYYDVFPVERKTRTVEEVYYE